MEESKEEGGKEQKQVGAPGCGCDKRESLGKETEREHFKDTV